MERRRISGCRFSRGDAVGMVSPRRLLRALARTLDEQPAATHGDDEILERIRAELRKRPGAERRRLDYRSERVVDLNGVILDEKEREALASSPKNPRS